MQLLRLHTTHRKEKNWPAARYSPVIQYTMLQYSTHSTVDTGSCVSTKPTTYDAGGKKWLSRCL